MSGFPSGGAAAGFAPGVFVLKAGDSMTGPLNMTGQAVTAVLDPLQAQDAATKHYVDAAIPGGQLVVNVKDYGAVGNGTTDDTTAINQAIAAVVAGGVLMFPQGRYSTQGGHVIDHAMTIWGPGRHQTFDSNGMLALRNGANADMLTIATPHVTIRDLSLYGNYPGQTATSRGLVTSSVTGANYLVLDNVWVDSFHDDGIVLQHPTGSLSCILTNVESRSNRRYGLNIVAVSDVEMIGGYIDQNVNSGIYTTGSNLSASNVHVWGNGTGSSGFLDGVTMDSSSGNRFVNCDFESNTNGRGVYAHSGTLNDHTFTGCLFFNNGLNGIYLFQTTHSSIVGCVFYRNNYKNQAGASGAGVLIDGCSGITTTGSVMWDTSVRRQTYGYFEQNAISGNVFVANICAAADHVSGAFVVDPSTLVVDPALIQSGPGVGQTIALGNGSNW